MADQELIYGYNRMPTGVILFPCSFRRTIFDFPLCLWLIYSHALGHMSSARHRFYLVQWVLNPIREQLVIPIMFVTLLHQDFMPAGNSCGLQGL